MGTSTVNDAITGKYDNGPVEIAWSISGTNYTQCSITVSFNESEVASTVLHPGRVKWDSGKTTVSDGWVDASLKMQVPTPDQGGELKIAKLAYDQDGQGEQVIENVTLQDWNTDGTHKP